MYIMKAISWLAYQMVKYLEMEKYMANAMRSQAETLWCPKCGGKCEFMWARFDAAPAVERGVWVCLQCRKGRK